MPLLTPPPGTVIDPPVETARPDATELLRRNMTMRHIRRVVERLRTRVEPRELSYLVRMLEA